MSWKTQPPFAEAPDPGTIMTRAPRTRSQITPRELQVIQLVADGHSTTTAAEVLGMAPSTARTHMGRILTSLDANTQAQAVAILMRRGLIR